MQALAWEGDYWNGVLQPQKGRVLALPIPPQTPSCHGTWAMRRAWLFGAKAKVQALAWKGDR